MSADNKLEWHYGPTPTDKDPGKMWCYGCGKEVMWIKDSPTEGGYVCTGCGKGSDE